MDWNNSVVLVTGGTGSFGQKFIEVVLQKYQLKKLIIFSRDELKQYDMQQRFSEDRHPGIRMGRLRGAGRGSRGGGRIPAGTLRDRQNGYGCESCLIRDCNAGQRVGSDPGRRR